jgi:hypothetical protein
MSTATTLDRIGVGIDTARYGHRVSFLRPDRQPAAKPLTVLENQAGYQALQNRLEQLHQQHPQAHCQVHGNVLDLWAALHRLPLYDAALNLAATFQLARNREEEPVK